MKNIHPCIYTLYIYKNLSTGDWTGVLTADNTRFRDEQTLGIDEIKNVNIKIYGDKKKFFLKIKIKMILIVEKREKATFNPR